MSPRRVGGRATGAGEGEGRQRCPHASKLRKAIKTVEGHLWLWRNSSAGFIRSATSKADQAGPVLSDRSARQPIRDWNFSIKRSAILPPLDQLFGPLLPAITDLIMTQNQFEGGRSVGFDGDEMRIIVDHAGLFCAEPLSLRDIER